MKKGMGKRAKQLQKGHAGGV